MKVEKVTAVVIIILSGLTTHGQDTWYGGMSGLHFMYNPAFTGAAGKPEMRLSCYSFLPGNGYSLGSVYGSYNDYSSSLHGGVGLWLSDDMLGDVMNDFRAGATYAYHLRAGNDLYFSAGLTASMVHRGIRAGSVILPEDLDPFLGYTGISSETISSGNVTLLDLGTGITVSKGSWYGGFAVMHLTQPWLSDRHQDHNRLRRLYSLNAGTSFEPGGKSLTISPSASMHLQDGYVAAYLGAELLYRELMCGLALWHEGSGFTAAVPALGWDTGTAKVILSYSYIIAGGVPVIKGTAIVRAGLSICFNNVEKRRVVHVIKLPDL
ncbi:MAG: PorP/SprF family type IX secretion system membrane protein [Bacteroidales bacterium]|nr:PorP/SprF family type IX secretion system membrane protein [Bacteroidales bacterium]